MVNLALAGPGRTAGDGALVLGVGSSAGAQRRMEPGPDTASLADHVGAGGFRGGGLRFGVVEPGRPGSFALALCGRGHYGRAGNDADHRPRRRSSPGSAPALPHRDGPGGGVSCWHENHRHVDAARPWSGHRPAGRRADHRQGRAAPAQCAGRRWRLASGAVASGWDGNAGGPGGGAVCRGRPLRRSGAPLPLALRGRSAA